MKKLGYAGILLISLSYWAQIWRIIVTGQVIGLSPLFFLLVWVGLVLLQVYSYSIRDWVFILSNWVGLANTSLLLGLIWLWN
jgi:uncharacterized protein with PQ loop repeat